MSEELLNSNKEKAADFSGEQHPGAAGEVGAERSEPERSDGERSGAATSPAAPPPTVSAAGPWGDGEVTEVGETPLTEEEVDVSHAGLPRLSGRNKGGRRLVQREQAKHVSLTVEQRLLLLDTWQRSGLPARDFAALVGMCGHTLYGWKKKFEAEGPAGLMDQPRGAPRGSRLPDLTRRTILMLKKANPDWGCQRISDMLVRGPALPASASAVRQVLHESRLRVGGSADAASPRQGVPFRAGQTQSIVAN